MLGGVLSDDLGESNCEPKLLQDNGEAFFFHRVTFIGTPGKWGRQRSVGQAVFNQIPYNPANIRLNSGRSPLTGN